jgi:hypothetical protein
LLAYAGRMAQAPRAPGNPAAVILSSGCGSRSCWDQSAVRRSHRPAGFCRRTRERHLPVWVAHRRLRALTVRRVGVDRLVPSLVERPAGVPIAPPWPAGMGGDMLAGVATCGYNSARGVHGNSGAQGQPEPLHQADRGR